MPVSNSCVQKGVLSLDIYEAICSRRTIRDFSEKPVSEEIVKRIIDAGLRAPTNDHMRKWEFIIVNDVASRLMVIDKIFKNATTVDSEQIVNNWGMTDGLQREMYIDAIPKQYQMLLNAGCLIIPCFQQSWPLLKPESLSSLNAFASMWLCIENMLLAAASEGIFGVTRIPFDDEISHIHEVLKIPEDYIFPCYLALGYPAEFAKRAVQHAVRAEERMHFNKW